MLIAWEKKESLSGGFSDNFRMILVLWRHFLVGYCIFFAFVTALNPVNFSGIFFDIDKPLLHPGITVVNHWVTE